MRLSNGTRDLYKYFHIRCLFISCSSKCQKNMMLEKQGGTHYMSTTFSPHHYDAHSLPRSHGVRVLPVSNPTNQISVSMTMPGHKSFVSPLGQNPVASPISAVPTNSAVVGTTDLRYVS